MSNRLLSTLSHQHGRQHGTEKVLKQIKITIKLIILTNKVMWKGRSSGLWASLQGLFHGFGDRSTRRRHQCVCWLLSLLNYLFSLTFHWFYDKLLLYWRESLSFKLTNITCMSWKIICLSVFTTIQSFSVPCGRFFSSLTSNRFCCSLLRTLICPQSKE